MGFKTLTPSEGSSCPVATSRYPMRSLPACNPYCPTRRTASHGSMPEGHPLWADVARRARLLGPRKKLHSRFVRWSKGGIFDRILQALADASTATGTVLIDTTHLKADRTAASLLKLVLAAAGKGAFPRHARRTRGGLNSKLHAVCDGADKAPDLIRGTGCASLSSSETSMPARYLIRGSAFQVVPTEKSRLPTTPSSTKPALVKTGEPQSHRAHVGQIQGLAPHRHTI